MKLAENPADLCQEFWTPQGALTTLHWFGSITNLEGISLDGASSVGELIEGQDHYFYGTTQAGGLYDSGTIFKLTTNGFLVSLYSFAEIGNGLGPTKLLQDRSGNLYGTTEIGGTNDTFYDGYGTIFRISTNTSRMGTTQGNPTFTNLVSFNGTTGAFPLAGLMQAKDGSFYGTTAGGFYSGGTIFRLSIIRPVINIFSPTRHVVFAPDITVSGRARGQDGITNVFYRINGGNWSTATTENAWTNWSANTVLNPGPNLIQAYAVDNGGVSSRTNNLQVLFRTLGRR